MAMALTWFIANAFFALAHADESGRGLTTQFETTSLKMIADHRLSALRMTELAAGTDATRGSAGSPDEGTSPTPNREPVQAKAQSTDSSHSRAVAIACKREEILTALGFLGHWYDVQYR